jgi:hypothetical protein
MASNLDPGLLKELTEAKGDLARHGIVIIRTVETELEPAIMAAVKDSLEASPMKLEDIKEGDLDELLGELRKAAMGSAKELAGLYIRLLGKLGTEYIGDLVKELEGIGQLFRWERISQVAKPVDDILGREGFGPVDLRGPSDISESFKLELESKWAPAFERFKALADRAAEQLGKKGMPEPRPARERKSSRKR